MSASPPDLSARLGLPYLMPAQAQKHVTHNEALARLDLLVQLVVQAFDAATPPALPQDGQIWALGPAPTGVWAGQTGALAAWVDGAWQFIPPQAGWHAVLVGPEGPELRIFTAAGWVVPGAEAFDNLAGLGVNTTHDATNRLAVAAAATLLTHEGTGHQLKINKAGAADTASLLFQTGWAGRAEMGLAGSDDFAVKVSADGSGWHTALAAEGSSGRITLPGGLSVGGTVTLPAGSIARAAMAHGGARSVVGRAAGSTGAVGDITAGSDHQVLRRSGSGIGFGAIALGQAAAVSGQLPLANGGTGAGTAAAARDNLGLGTAAVAQLTTSPEDTTTGRVLRVGDFNIGASANLSNQHDDLNDHTVQGIFGYINTADNRPPANGSLFSNSLEVFRDSAGGRIYQISRQCGGSTDNGYEWHRVFDGSSWSQWWLNWTQRNTTVDANGFIKAASPIVRLYVDGTEEPVQPVGATFERLGVGEYRLGDVEPLAATGWQIEVPQDANGNRLVFVATGYDPDARALSVTTTAPVWSMEQMAWTAGAARDIPAGRWIDLRLSPPAVADNLDAGQDTGA